MPSEAMTSRITTEIAKHPEVGMTAKQLAEVLNWTPARTSCLLGRLFNDGNLDRRCSDPAHRKNEFIYIIPTKPAAKPLWVPSIERPAPGKLPRWARRYAAIADRLAEGEVV